MAKVGKFCLAKRVKVEWLFHISANISSDNFSESIEDEGVD